MDKFDLTLKVLSLAILLLPLLAVVAAYSGNPSGLVWTPQMKSFTSGDLSQTQFKLPVPAGNPTFDPSTGVVTFSFIVNNPLGNEISVTKIEADMYCKDHNVALGSVKLDKPIKIQPGETVTVEAFGYWSEDALWHFRAFHNGSEDDDVNVAFKNLDVDLAGVSIHMAVLEDAGWVMIPK